MNSKVLVRILIVILAALLILRIHQRIESYRIPESLCRNNMVMLARANIRHMYENDGASAPDMDSLLSYAGLPDSVGVCPTLWQAGLTDSLYHFDPRLALGTQFTVSCPNHNRHGGVVAGLIDKDFPDSLFCEADWMNTYTRYPFEQHALNRMTEQSRANLVRVGEEQMIYLASRYPRVFLPVGLAALGVSADELIDPLGGEYVFETLEDTLYVFYEYPQRRWNPGRSVEIQTYRFIGYATSNPDTTRIEIFYRRPLALPSLAEGAVTGSNDRLTLIRYWDRNELGTLQIDQREVDLLEEPRWEFLSSYFLENE
ncbi:hypothetical protein JW921_02365 [Candidatus Fermentibacterales bacterium]|nr:hypothetical protein [Candidatus Fermentibacterales bacterium]